MRLLTAAFDTTSDAASDVTSDAASDTTYDAMSAASVSVAASVTQVLSTVSVAAAYVETEAAKL